MTRNSKKILVTGGAGFIGRCVAAILEKQGYSPHLVDNFSSSPELPPEICTQVDLTDAASSESLFKKHGPYEAVFHFAAKTLVSESFLQPAEYLRNNINAALNVVTFAAKSGCKKLVHSSTCAVYGTPKFTPLTEEHPVQPISPYGESKWLAEQALNCMAAQTGVQIVHLRYFNPGGAVQSATGEWLGEQHNPETHLIPRVVDAALNDQPVTVFGADYPTPDGTCERDYIHIEDLAMAHLAALNWLQTKPIQSPEVFNIGAGKASSVLQVIKMAEQVLKKTLSTNLQPRRAGDPPALLADNTKVRGQLNWSPRLGLEEIISSHLQSVLYQAKKAKK